MDIYYFIINISYALFGILNILLIYYVIDYIFVHLRNRHFLKFRKKENVCIIGRMLFALIITLNIQIYFFSKREVIINKIDKMGNMMLWFIVIILHLHIFLKIYNYLCKASKNFIINEKEIGIKDNPVKETKTLKKITNSSDELDKYIFAYNINDGQISVNDNMRSIIGYTREELLGMKLTDLISDEKMKNLMQFCYQKEKSCEINTIIDLKRKDGQFIIAKISGALIVSKGKKIIKGVIKEITEKIAVEIDVLKTNIILKEMIENMEMYKVIVIDRNYQVLIINNESKEFLKKKTNKKISVGMNFLDIVSMIDTEKELSSLYSNFEKCVKSASEGKVITNVVEIPNESNEKEYLQVQFMGLKDNKENKIGIAIFTHDITENYKRKEELIKAKEKAIEANKAKSQFLANMSHEIRTPMNGIIGLTDIMIKTELDDSQKIMMNAIKNSAKNLLYIINDILDYSKIESGSYKILNKPFNFYELIDEIKMMFYTKVMEKKINIEYDIDKNINTLLIGDKLRLKQILINLIGNAIKFTEEGKITVRIKKECNENVIKFQIIDTGIGIPKEYIDVIFESFTQVEDSYEKRYSGTGLGLAITKELVEAIGGNITVKTNVNVGSEFSFSIKLEEVNNYISNDILDKKNYRNEEIKYIEEQIDKKPHILVAEDNEVNKLLIEKLISLNKWTCKIAKNGKEAIEMLEKEKFEIILMDISMPIMSGIEAMNIIRNNNKWDNIPIVALTAHCRTQDKNKFISLGMDDYLSKPIDKEKLNFTVMKNLALFNKVNNADFPTKNKKEYCDNYQQDDKTKFSKKLEELKKLEKKIDGDKETVIELAEELTLLFSNDKMIEFNAIISSNSFKEAREEIHKLKGAVLNFGLCNIYNLLNKIEIGCNLNERDKNNVIINEILEEISIFKEAIMVYKYIH